MSRQEANELWEKLNRAMLADAVFRGYRPILYNAGEDGYKVAIREAWSEPSQRL